MDDPTGMLGDHIREANAGDSRGLLASGSKTKQGTGILKAARLVNIFPGYHGKECGNEVL